MRNLSPNLSNESSVVSVPPRSSSVAAQVTVNSAQSVGQSVSKEIQRSYSQLSRQSRMLENTYSVRSFMDEQQRVIKDLIKQFQIYVGYREQLPESTSATSSDSWSVYLMHVQSLQAAMKQSHRGKALFSNGSFPPIRVHLEYDGIVSPFDLPDPSLSSMISVQSFLAGVLDHKLPSIELGNACMTELLNALVEIQDGKSRFCKIQYQLSARKASRRPLKGTYISSTDPSTPQSSVPTWFQKMRFGFNNLFRPFLPGNALG